MKNKDIIEIEAITINIGDTSVKVTPEQATRLFDALADLLGKPKQTITWYPYSYPWTTVTGTGQYPLTSGSATYNVSNCADSRVIDIQ